MEKKKPKPVLCCQSGCVFVLAAFLWTLFSWCAFLIGLYLLKANAILYPNSYWCWTELCFFSFCGQDLPTWENFKEKVLDLWNLHTVNESQLPKAFILFNILALCVYEHYVVFPILLMQHEENIKLNTVFLKKIVAIDLKLFVQATVWSWSTILVLNQPLSYAKIKRT